MQPVLLATTLLGLTMLTAPPVEVLDRQPALPKGLPIEGEPVARLRYRDRDGTYLVVVTETKPVTKPAASDEDDDTSSKRLFVHNFQEKKGRFKQTWVVKDFELDCAFDLTLSLVEGSLTVTDLDEDGRAEVTVVYRLQCTSDVSPAMVKLIMYEGRDKYALRGQERVHVGQEDGKPVYVGGESELDAAFRKGPPSFSRHAQAVWDRAAGASPRPSGGPDL